MQIIYIDTVFFLNSTIDYLLLLAAAKVAGEPLKRLRFAFGAVIGGGYAVLIFFFPFLQSHFYKMLLGVLIVLVAYGSSRRLLRQGLIFLSLSFAFAGGILGISLLGGQGLMLESGIFYSPMDVKMVLLSAAFCYLLLSVVFHQYGRHSQISGEIVSVTVVLGDKEINLTALIDTGNTLQDPLSGTGVMVVEGERLSPFFQEKLSGKMLKDPTAFLTVNQEHSTRFRLLPYQVVGAQGVLLVMKVDKIFVGGDLICENLLALSPTAVSDGGAYHGLLPVYTISKSKAHSI
ncbi:MAG: sigma-E processing peptidase SpoIIGA [Eubacteriales bacterium]